jgi:hypothetical protein
MPRSANTTRRSQQTIKSDKAGNTAELSKRLNLILPDGQISESCPAPFAKIFLFSPDPNHFYIHRRPTPHEGRIAIVTDAGWDAVDAAASGTQRDRRAR